MNRSLSISVLVLTLSIFAVGSQAAEIADGRVLVAFEPGTRLSLDKSADGAPQTGVAGLDLVLDRRDALSIEPLFHQFLHMFDDPEVREEMARHYIVRHANKSGNDGLINDLKSLAMVETAESDMLMPMHGNAYMPDDLAGPQWHLRNTSLGGGDTRAVGGWAEGLGDSTVVVAVLDTGVDWHHPDLGGTHPDKVNGAVWTNWTEYYGTPGVDDDSNGFVDDIRGWDFVNVSSGQVFPGEDYGPPDNDPMDFNSHGTLVSGCISPITDNSTGVAAIAPGCKIMAIRIGWHTAEGDGVAYASYMAQAFLYAVNNGADIINLSYGTSYYGPFSTAVTTALNAGLVICVSAGNDNEDVPGWLQDHSDDRVLTVAASNSNDGKADFSDYGVWVDVTAPGKNIYTTSYSFQTGESTYSSTQGTSFSSPIVAGACALIWSQHPELSSAEVAALIQNTCDDIDHLNPGYEGLLGHGRINLLRALGDNEQRVPEEFFELQDAINMATPGDVIKVLASEPLDMFTVVGKDLTVEGAYADGYVSRDPMGTPTLVHASGVSPGLEFYGEVTTSTVVDGFEIENGGGRTFSDIPYPGRYGGGVVITGQSPTLRNLTLSDNTVGSSNQLGCGGAILLHDSQALLEDIVITGNTATYGAGIFIYEGGPTLRRVTIDANTVITDDLANSPRGGGLHILDADVIMEDVTVTNHLDTGEGGGIYLGQVTAPATLTWTGGELSGNAATTLGGGMCANGSGAIDLMDVVIADNGPTPLASFMSGGAIYANGVNVTLDGCTVSGNSSQSAGGLQLVGCADVQLSSTTLVDNNSTIFGGTVYLTSCVNADLTGLTLAYNNNMSGGAGINAVSTPMTVSNTISAYNTGGAAAANGINTDGAATLSCNDVVGNDGANYGGVADPTGTDGNISLDPMFCDVAEGDFRVATTSPCAPANSGGCGLIGALEASCGSTPVEESDTPVAFTVSPNYPNPFNPVTTIKFALPASARTTVNVFDLRGRLVKTLVNAEMVAAVHTVQWRGDDATGRPAAAGIYFYEVRSGGHRDVGRMALVK